jgi:putative toxin-antitoxin system antitoxin component (TIGR02293 family)
MALIDEVGDGLPVSALESVARQVAPQDSGFAYRLVPRATLARRRKERPGRRKLSPDEGAKVTRLAEVWAMAVKVWGGEEEARAFLQRPHPMLDGRRPLDVVLASEFGRPLVEGILGQLQHGSAA